MSPVAIETDPDSPSHVHLDMQVHEPLIGSSSTSSFNPHKPPTRAASTMSNLERAAWMFVVFMVVFLGLLLGLTMPTDVLNPPPWDRVSAIMGWTYFVAWSISFYPQIIANWRRKSVVGLSFDFLAYAWIGFFCYSCFTCGLYFSPEIKEAYRHMYKSENDVQANDVLFALHALAATTFIVFQCVIYERGAQVMSRLCKTACWTFGLFAAGGVVVITFEPPLFDMDQPTQWLWYLYLFSLVKVALTIVKYVPQVQLNQETQSTKGWSIGNVLLDVTGGVLSISQSVLDCIARNDVSVIIGNPIRLSIGFWSIVFDIIFMLQHYLWFPGEGEELKDS